MNIIIFGSAVTQCYRYGEEGPHDIDVLTDDKEAAKAVVEKWSLDKFGKILPADIHKIERNKNGEILVPVLNGDTIEYDVIESDSPIQEDVRENGFASMLRLHGNDENEFSNYLSRGKQYLSLLPPQYSYYSDIQNRDKYYSGLLAFRNAVAHVPNFQELAKKTNCENLLLRLLNEDPVNWKCSSDIGGSGFGWDHAFVISVSANKADVALRDGKVEMTEKEAIDFLF